MTWQIFFELIKKMRDVKQTEIAGYLDVHRSTISRLIHGQQRTFNRTINEIYFALFDPSNKKSFVSSIAHNDTNDLLKFFKETLHELALDNEVKQLYNNDYEKFMIGILKLVKKSESPKFSFLQDEHNCTSPNKEESQQDNKIPPKEMFYEFWQNCRDFGIGDFIRQNPFEALFPYQIQDALRFYGHINEKHERGDSPDKDSTLYQSIISFIDTLFKYIKMLKRCSSNIETFPYDFTPIKDSELSQEIENVRKNLQLLYNDITATIQDKQNKLQKE